MLFSLSPSSDGLFVSLSTLDAPVSVAFTGLTLAALFLSHVFFFIFAPATNNLFFSNLHHVCELYLKALIFMRCCALTIYGYMRARGAESVTDLCTVTGRE